MAEFTRKEFAALCHTTVLMINTNVSRKKLVVNEDGKMDSEHPRNKAFFNRYNLKYQKEIKKLKEQASKNTNLYEQVVEVVKTPEVKKETKKKRKPTSDEKLATDTMSWELRKKVADALLQERKAEKEKMSLEKMAGNLLPVNLVENIFTINLKAIFKSMELELENIASLTNDMLGGSRDDLAAITKMQREALSKAIADAKENGGNEIEVAVNEYQEIRGVGERR
jgi:hypothetical protein